MQQGNGKRWLLVGLLVLGGFWLVNDVYDDGYRDALVQTGQMQEFRHYDGDPDFPWGLLILAGIGYFAWRKGAFDRFGGPGGLFGNGGHHGERGVQRYGTGSSLAPTSNASSFSQGESLVFRGPRAFFEEWHRQAHEEAARTQRPVPRTPPEHSSGAEDVNHGASQRGFAPTPPPTPPAPEYWASMAGSAEAAGTAGGPVASPAASAAPQDENSNSHRAAGTAV